MPFPQWRRGLFGVALIVALLTSTAAADDHLEDAVELRCGATQRGTLSAGEVAEFRLQAQRGQRIAIDAIDISGGAELLRLRMRGEGVATNTCTGRIQPPMRAATLLVSNETYSVEVSDCKSTESVEYAITLSTVSAISQNCGVQLPCGERTVAEFSLPGEIDSYRFDGTVGDTINLQSEETAEGLDGVELRVFDPEGLPVEEGAASSGCASVRSLVLPKSGVYTVLANPCFGSGVGAYQIGWYPGSCPGVTLLGNQSDDDRFYVRTSSDGTAIVELGSGRLSCAFAETSGFLIQPNPSLAIENGRFAGHDLRLPARALSIDVDGALTDSDGDGHFDQAVGGLSVAKEGGRCHFRWAGTTRGDADGDGWADAAEVELKSDRYERDSTPEGGNVPTTTLLGPSSCRDWADNDGDGDADGQEESCQPLPAIQNDSPRLFAGRHSDSDALWLQLSSDGNAIVRVGSVGLGCGTLHQMPEILEVDVPILQGRFSADSLALPSGHSWSIDGVLFDGDNDAIYDQALGGVRLHVGDSDCQRLWWATAYLDSDSDGWGDNIERHYGSDPRPLPSGKGALSTPEDGALPTTALFGPSSCSDSIDNDDDGRVDSQDLPSCNFAPATETPAPTQTPMPTFPPTATSTVPIPTTPIARCVGDCDQSGDVTVDEVVRGVVIILGEAGVACSALDGNVDGQVTVDELVTAVNHLLLGC